jgi:hypothetical protein
VTTRIPWHNHPFVEDKRYKHCKTCGWAKEASHHTKRPKRSLVAVLKRKPWRVYVARQNKK